MIAAPVTLCNAASKPLPGEIILSIVAGRPVVGGVFLNGFGPYRFLLDTGAQTNQLDARIAAKVGFQASFRVEMAPLGQTILVPGVRGVEIGLGPASISNQEVLFTALEGVKALSPAIQGVLGQEFLAHFDYLLDFANRRLVLGEGEPDGGVRVSFERIDGRPAIETSQGRLVLDSGTDIAVMLSGGTGMRRTVRTAAGDAEVTAIDGLQLRIAGRTWRCHQAVSARKTRGGEDGLLPASLFHAIFVSNSGGYAVLDSGRR